MLLFVVVVVAACRDESYARFTADAAALRLLLSQQSLAHARCAAETQEAEALHVKIDAAIASTEEEILALKQELEVERRRRAQRLEYERVAADMSTLKTRRELNDLIAAAHAEIEAALGEGASLDTQIKQGRARLEEVMTCIDDASSAIHSAFTPPADARAPASGGDVEPPVGRGRNADLDAYGEDARAQTGGEPSTTTAAEDESSDSHDGGEGEGEGAGEPRLSPLDDGAPVVAPVDASEDAAMNGAQ